MEMERQKGRWKRRVKCKKGDLVRVGKKVKDKQEY